ncbi:MAG: PIN domain-containing protein [Nanoarchaeota archaeon]
MEAVLDANFIISCMKRKIDFIDALESAGFKIAVPREVIQELKDLKNNVRHDDRVAIDTAFSLLEGEKVKKIKLGQGRVDERLIGLGRRGAYIATLDSAIKRAVPNRIIINNAKNAIFVERS